VVNYGSQSASFDVDLHIGSSYSATATVTSVPAGSRRAATFSASWAALDRGWVPMRCSTKLAGDQVASNNRKLDSVFVRVRDVGTVGITSPVDSIPSGPVIPRADAHNWGNAREACKVYFRISASPAYVDSVVLPAGLPFADTSLSFKNWTATAGSYTVRCSAAMTGDVRHTNDAAGARVVVRAAPPNAGWAPKASMPSGAAAIKDGGWLAWDAGKVRVYASRGVKQPDFYAYAPGGDAWTKLASWLPGSEGKLPSKGSAGCATGTGVVYATKGNNTQGFWMFKDSANAWSQQANVPLGLTNKKVKGGTDIVWAYKGGVGYVYLLKGYRNEFWRYDVGGDSWHALANAPGAIPKWDKGSWLAYDGAHTIYAHKAKFHEYYKYDTEGEAWSPTALLGMPVAGSAGSRKSKDGGCGTYLNSYVYALKGGNTQEFWRYDVAANAWAEKETIPKGTLKKKVKAGADIVGTGTALYATKGNKTNELWMYLPGAFAAVPEPQREGVLAGQKATSDWRPAISPNPVTSGFAVLSFPGAPGHSGAGALSFFDISGRCVFSSAFAVRSSPIRIDLRQLAGGVYVVRLETGGSTARQKLVVRQ
jgi:hypothetical protein